MHPVGFIIRIRHDARSPERQIDLRHFAVSGKFRNNFKQWPLEHCYQVLELRAGEMLIPLHVLQCLVEHLCWITSSSTQRDLLPFLGYSVSFSMWGCFSDVRCPF